MDDSLLERAVRRTQTVRNVWQDDPSLHPDRTVRHFITLIDPLEALALFSQLLHAESEHDEGDWKRDVNAGLMRLREQLIDEPLWVLKTLDNMQALLNWSYREDLENLRYELSMRAEGIAKGLLKQKRGA